MRLDPEVSDAVTQVNGNPTTNVRRASTNVRVRPGETIVIGGLVQDISSARVVRIPVLGSLPVIGELFTQRLNSRRKVETIITITPRLDPAAINAPGAANPKGTPAGSKPAQRQDSGDGNIRRKSGPGD
jgi:type II secretory pathway component GspD/PulD (secretin)